MSVSGVSNNNTVTTPPPSASAGAAAGMSQSDFYKIIVAQLENQTIDNTTDSNAMVQNMMSISNYQAINGMSSNVNKMTNNSTATSLLGKTVSVTPAGGQTASGTVTNVDYASDGSASVTINGTGYDIDYVTSVANPAATPTNSTGN